MMGGVSRRRWTDATVFLALVGCGGGGNGLDPSKKLVDLTPAESRRLCNPAGATMIGSGCADAGLSPDLNDPNSCFFPLSPDCTATVAVANQCDAALSNNRCSLPALSTPACVLMEACYGGLCPVVCDCTTPASRTQCLGSCATYTAGLTIACATCISGLRTPGTCLDFTALPAPYDQCTSVCGPGDAGANRG